jgi:TolB-like protein/Tfp pilus assembly protein PilF
MPRSGSIPDTLGAGFQLAGNRAYPLENRIEGPDGQNRLEPKAMAVLVELASRAPDVCTRDELVERVWPRGYVSDDVLTRCIGQLRKALGDNPRSPAILETIPRRGYRLRCPVEPIAAAPMRLRPAGRGRASLIVLPFQNLSAGGEDFVADGITELLIARLAAITELRVISRTTAMRFKGSDASVADIASSTDTDWVIEGSVLQSGDRIQVVAQLIDAHTDAHVWAADYLRDLQDVLLLQNEIVARVASAIRMQLGAAQETPRTAPRLEPQVVRDYLKARHLISRRAVPQLAEARALLAQVSARAPDYASGWASLAESEMLLAHYGAPGIEELLAACEAHLERALTLEPDLAIALSTRGALRFFFQRDFDGAVRDLEQALNVMPGYALAMLSLANACAVRRDFAEASAWMAQALLVDPLDVGINMNMGDHLLLQGRYEEAVQALERALEIAPDHRPSGLRLAWALALAGRHEAAGARLAQHGDATSADSQWLEYAAMLAGLRGDAALAGEHHAALKRLSDTERVAPWLLARAAAAAGEVDEAFAWLERAALERSSSMPFLLVTPAFRSLHGDPRLTALAAKLGLPAGRA